jgi:urease accessory protein
MRIRLPRILALFLLSPSFSHAHSMAFTAMDWNSGFLHPLQGIDHIIAMLAVGFWAAQLRGVALWVLPLTFVSVMSLGGLIGMTNLEIPSAEVIILLSGFVLSVLAVKNIRFDIKVNMLIVAFFALFHGYAHGAEITDSADLTSFGAGFIVSTGLLHCTGMMLNFVSTKIRLTNFKKINFQLQQQ